MDDYPDLRAAVQDVAAVISAEGFRQVDVDLNLCGPRHATSCRFIRRASRYGCARRGGYVDVDTSLSLTQAGIAHSALTASGCRTWACRCRAWPSTTNVLVGGEPVSKYKEQDEQYDVWLRAERRAATTARPLPA